MCLFVTSRMHAAQHGILFTQGVILRFLPYKDDAFYQWG